MSVTTTAKLVGTTAQYQGNRKKSTETEKKVSTIARPNRGRSDYMRSVTNEEDEKEVILKKLKFKVIKPNFFKNRANDIMEDPDESDIKSVTSDESSMTKEVKNTDTTGSPNRMDTSNTSGGYPTVETKDGENDVEMLSLQ